MPSPKISKAAKFCVAVFCALLILIVSGTILWHRYHPDTDKVSEVKVWQTRAALTVDRPGAARKVVLDSIYAGHSADLAVAYEALYQQHPSQARLGSYFYSAVMANSYASQRHAILHHEAAVDIANRAIAAAKPYVPDARGFEKQVRSPYDKTIVPEIWLAWGMHLSYGPSDTAAYRIEASRASFQQALRLNPKMGEAYLGIAYLIQFDMTPSYVKSHADETNNQLNKAEALEPKLHVLTLPTRAYVAGYCGQYDKSEKYMREYLRLWPDSPNAAVIRRSYPEK